MPHSVRVARILAAAGAMLPAASALHAQVRHWTNAAGGNYQSPSNWLEFTFPGQNEMAAFDIGATYTVSLSLGAINAGMSVSNGFPSFDFSLGPLTVNNEGFRVGTAAMSARAGVAAGNLTVGGDGVTLARAVGGSGRFDVMPGTFVDINGPLVVGVLGAGSLHVTGASVDCGDAIFGQSSAATGVVNVSGAASLDADSTMFIASVGGANATVSGGATMTAPLAFIGTSHGSVGELTVTGMGSQFTCGGELVVASSGDGSLFISDKGTVSTGQGSIGANAGSDGSAFLMDPATTWSMGGALQVGLRGKGMLSVAGGADASSTAAGFFGVFDGGDADAVVSGTGSTLTFGGQLQVGRESPAELTIEDGAMVSNSAAGSASGTAGIIGLQNAGNGKVTVTGAGSSWSNLNGSLVIGWNAIGALDVLAGGVVNSGSGFVGRLFGSAGTVKIDGSGSRWASTGQVRIGVDPNGQQGGFGSVTVSNAGALQAGGVMIGVAGSLRGNGAVTSASVDNAGIVAPGGAAPGTMTINGAFTQTTGGRLQIDIDSTGADRLAVTGAASLAGAMNITVPTGFSPSAGTVFTVVQAGSRSGVFSSVTTTPMPGGRAFSIGYSANAVTLTVVIPGGCPGDANGDMVVDFIDLNIVLSQLGQSGPGLNGDLNNDGVVDFVDLNIVLSGYGSTC